MKHHYWESWLIPFIICIVTQQYIDSSMMDLCIYELSNITSSFKMSHSIHNHHSTVHQPHRSIIHKWVNYPSHNHLIHCQILRDLAKHLVIIVYFTLSGGFEIWIITFCTTLPVRRYYFNPNSFMYSLTLTLSYRHCIGNYAFKDIENLN